MNKVQLAKKDCSLNKYTNIYPEIDLSLLEYDGKSLPDFLHSINKDCNHIFLPYLGGDEHNTDVENTLLQIPQEFRRKGLFISFVNNKGKVVTGWYIGRKNDNNSVITDNDWKDLSNWQEHDPTSQYVPLVNGKVPLQYLPAGYIDDVIEVENINTWEGVPQKDKVYVDTSTNWIYRWSGSTWTVIGNYLGLGENENEAFPGDRGVALEELTLGMQTGDVELPYIKNTYLDVKGFQNSQTSLEIFITPKVKNNLKLQSVGFTLSTNHSGNSYISYNHAHVSIGNRSTIVRLDPKDESLQYLYLGSDTLLTDSLTSFYTKSPETEPSLMLPEDKHLLDNILVLYYSSNLTSEQLEHNKKFFEKLGSSANIDCFLYNIDTKSIELGYLRYWQTDASWESYKTSSISLLQSKGNKMHYNPELECATYVFNPLTGEFTRFSTMTGDRLPLTISSIGFYKKGTLTLSGVSTNRNLKFDQNCFIANADNISEFEWTLNNKKQPIVVNNNTQIGFYYPNNDTEVLIQKNDDNKLDVEVKSTTDYSILKTFTIATTEDLQIKSLDD